MKTKVSIYHFTVNNYGYGEKTELFVVANNEKEAYQLVVDEHYNIDHDNPTFKTEWFIELEEKDLNFLPYIDKTL